MPSHLPLSWAFLLSATWSRTLPDKNELANACYFTYRVGYVICDASLGPEAAQKEMEAGRCNADFRLMGSDFQRLVLKHYMEGGRPPLEEAMWLLTSSENFQTRTLSECPPMQILANMLYGEALLYLDGPSRDGESAMLVAQAIEQTKRVQPEVLNALARTWPLDMATHRFQETFLALQGMAKGDRKLDLVHFVLCRCDEDLSWLEDGFFEKLSPEVVSGATAKGPKGSCPAQIALTHVLRYKLDFPEFLLFLPSAAPLEQERYFYQLVLNSLLSHTLTADFVALGSTRAPPVSLDMCQRSLIQSGVLPIWNYPLGYEGSRFLVSAKRLVESIDRVASLMAAFAESGCTTVELEEAIANWWHIVFGEPAQLPIRAEDERLPMFLRVADGPSGFSRTRMPKSSDYLNWAATDLDET
ncbi:unnamed protein product [Durusdinium trenchii]|uniref:Uncharacterized protein n=1 Tax=Durusdinium trenchii TaxID=1381693 RepID=A0ABP0KPQ4_9DINO